jgi:hypothetical protein
MYNFGIELGEFVYVLSGAIHASILCDPFGFADLMPNFGPAFFYSLFSMTLLSVLH